MKLKYIPVKILKAESAQGTLCVIIVESRELTAWKLAPKNKVIYLVERKWNISKTDGDRNKSKSLQNP